MRARAVQGSQHDHHMQSKEVDTSVMSVRKKKTATAVGFEVGSLLKIAYLGFRASSAVHCASVHSGWFASFIITVVLQ